MSDVNPEQMLALRDSLLRELVGRHERAAAEVDRRLEQRFAAQQTALAVLADTVADRRAEDAEKVRLALDAVREAARLHDEAHGERHRAHAHVHEMERDALSKADAAMDKRMDAVNGFREQLRDQAGHLMPRAEAIARADANAEKIAQLSTRLDRAEGAGDGGALLRANIISLVMTLIAFVGIVLAIYNSAK